MNTDHLPSSVANTVKGIVERKSSTLTVAIPKGTADYFNYKIIIEDGKKTQRDRV